MTYTQAALDDYLAEAFSRIQIRGDQINGDHIVEATRSAQLMLSSWAADGVRQGNLQLATVSTVAGQATILQPAINAAALQIFSGTIRVPGNFDVPMVRISRSDYEQIPDKANSNRPDRFFWDASGNVLSARSLTLWPVPDQVYTLRLWCICRSADVGGLTTEPDIGFEWWDAFASGLARRLARKYAPQLYADMAQEAGGPDLPGVGAYAIAKRGDRERGPAVFRWDVRQRTSAR